MAIIKLSLDLLTLDMENSRSLQDFKISPFTAIQSVRSYHSTIVQARKLILSMYVHLIIIFQIHDYRNYFMNYFTNP